MPIHALSTAEAADRAGMPVEAVRSLIRRGGFAEPDVIVGGTIARAVRGWAPETVDAWVSTKGRSLLPNGERSAR